LRGLQNGKLAYKFHGFFGEFPEFHAGFAAVAFAEADGDVVVGPAGFFQQDGQGDIGEKEVGGDFFEDGEEFFCSDEAVGDICVGAVDALGGEKDGFQDEAGEDAAPTVIAFGADAVDDIKFFPESPKAEKVLGVALAIGVDLEDMGNLVFAGEAVAGEAGLAVAAVGVGEDFEAGAELVVEAAEDFKGVVGGAVVEAEKSKVFGPVFDFLKPFEHDFSHGGLLVIDGQDDGNVGGHLLKS
jgi:hypothetical protein